MNAPDTGPPGIRPAAGLGLDPDIDQVLAELRRAFPGLCIWHGEFSGSLWALLPDRLVEARTAADLARRLHTALGQARPRAEVEHVPRRATPSTRRPDGTWTAPKSRGPASRKKATGRAHRVGRRLLTDSGRESSPVPSSTVGRSAAASRSVGYAPRSKPGSRFRRFVRWLLTSCLHLTTAAPLPR